MTADGWNWKSGDGSRGGLLYEPGNWGDLLKLLWLAAAIRWKAGDGTVDYFDPFAGDVAYPLAEKTKERFNRAGPAELDFVRAPFIEKGSWPSAAAAAGCLPVGRRRVFDADAEKLKRWSGEPGVETLAGESGWSVMAAREADPREIWLIDPYDFLADWRTSLPLVAGGSGKASILLYAYNRSAAAAEAFASHRAFRNALADARRGLPGCFGRTAADAFLPRAHHEMYFLPCPSDAAREDFPAFSATLERLSGELAAAQAGTAAFGAV
jgi:hypothetical protein